MRKLLVVYTAIYNTSNLGNELWLEQSIWFISTVKSRYSEPLKYRHLILTDV